MRNIVGRLVILVGFLIIIICFSVEAQERKPTIQSLTFISGCWEMSKAGNKTLVSEQWMSPVGNAMLGMSRTIRNDRLGTFEHLRIVEDETGINYISKPSQNKEETSFKLVKWSENDATFENPAHDFPQRIIYKLTKPDTLFARIEGTVNGKTNGVDFRMTRAKCG